MRSHGTGLWRNPELPASQDFMTPPGNGILGGCPQGEKKVAKKVILSLASGPLDLKGRRAVMQKSGIARAGEFRDHAISFMASAGNGIKTFSFSS
jgi:hypothetical protein